MRGVVFLGDRQLELMEFPDPTPGEGEVVLEMKASGMCGSDLHQYRRAKGGELIGGLPVATEPVIAGHEPCGIVAAVGPAWPEVSGQGGPARNGASLQGLHRVQSLPLRLVAALPGSAGKGVRQQRPWRACQVPEGAGLYAGAIARRAVLRRRRGDSCGTGTAYGALRRIRLSGNDTIAIFGQGPVGLSATQLAKAMGARVIALDVSEERLNRAKEFGADEIVNPRSNDPVGAIKDLTHGYGAEFTLDTSIAARGPHLARCARQRCGARPALSASATASRSMSAPTCSRKQLTIVASWTFSQMGQAECAQFIADRGIDVEKLFTHTWQLDQADEAYKLFDTQTTGKGVFLI